MYYKKVVLQFLRKNYVSTILPIILLFQVFFYFHAITLSWFFFSCLQIVNSEEKGQILCRHLFPSQLLSSRSDSRSIRARPSRLVN